MRRRMFPPHDVAELVHTIEFTSLGVEQLDDTPKVIREVSTGQVSCVEIPNPGAAGELGRARPSIKNVTLPMGSLWRDRQNGGYFGGIEFVARKPQGGVNLRQPVKACRRGSRSPRRDYPRPCRFAIW